jgi:hypothetical protein
MMSGGTMSGRVESSCPNLTNVGPAELVEHLAEVPAARGLPRLGVAGRAAVDGIAEAVPDGDLCDLAQPAEIALLGARCHGESVARSPLPHRAPEA